MAYFYSGNVTISNYIDEHKKTDSDIIKMVDELDKFSLLLTKISSELKHWNSAEFQAKRKQFAIQNSYDNKIKEISKIMYEDN